MSQNTAKKIISGFRQGGRQSESTRQANRRPAQTFKATKSSKAVVQGSEATDSLPHKYKTEMCRNFYRGFACAFGKKCNYAHGDKELVKFKKLAQQMEQDLEGKDLQPEPLVLKSMSQGHPVAKKEIQLDWTSKLGQALISDEIHKSHVVVLDSPRSGQFTNKSMDLDAAQSTQASESELFYGSGSELAEGALSEAATKQDSPLKKHSQLILAPKSHQRSVPDSSRPIYQSLLQCLEEKSQRLLSLDSACKQMGDKQAKVGADAWTDTWWESVHEEALESLSLQHLTSTRDEEASQAPATFKRLACFQSITISEDDEEQLCDQTGTAAAASIQTTSTNFAKSQAEELGNSASSQGQAPEMSHPFVTVENIDTDLNAQSRSQRGSRKYKNRRLYRVETQAMAVATF